MMRTKKTLNRIASGDVKKAPIGSKATPLLFLKTLQFLASPVTT